LRGRFWYLVLGRLLQTWHKFDDAFELPINTPAPLLPGIDGEIVDCAIRHAEHPVLLRKVRQLRDVGPDPSPRKHRLFADEQALIVNGFCESNKETRHVEKRYPSQQRRNASCEP